MIVIVYDIQCRGRTASSEEETSSVVPDTSQEPQSPRAKLHTPGLKTGFITKQELTWVPRFSKRFSHMEAKKILDVSEKLFPVKQGKC